MQTVSYSPAAPLSRFIDIIWFSQAGRFDYTNLTLPMLHQEMIINFSSQFIVARAAGIEYNQQIQSSKQASDLNRQSSVLVNNEQGWISGLQTRPVQTTTAGTHFTVGVLFKPWGLQALTGIDAFELQDSSVSLETIFGQEATALIGKIDETQTPEEIFPVLEKFLLAKFSPRPVPPFLLQSVNRLKQISLEEGVVQRVAGELSVSPKTLIQSFKKYIGLTPGRFHHLLLLNQTLQYLTQNPAQPLTGSGYDLHFFDQSHFIHFFKQYTGFTPSAYIKRFKAGHILPDSPHSIEIKVPG